MGLVHRRLKRTEDFLWEEFCSLYLAPFTSAQQLIIHPPQCTRISKWMNWMKDAAPTFWRSLYSQCGFHAGGSSSPAVFLQPALPLAYWLYLLVKKFIFCSHRVFDFSFSRSWTTVKQQELWQAFLLTYRTLFFFFLKSSVTSKCFSKKKEKTKKITRLHLQPICPFHSTESSFVTFGGFCEIISWSQSSS